MKNGTFVWRLATVTAGGFLLPLVVLAAPQKKVAFTGTEVVTWVNYGTALTDNTNLLIMGATGNTVKTSSDPRIAGAGTVTASAVWDMQTLGPIWGSTHSANAGGAWDGYVVGTNSYQNGHIVLNSLSVAVGSGGYQGLVYRKEAMSLDGGPQHFIAYIVEGGPGDLPLRTKGSRVDRVQFIRGMYLNPTNFSPTGVFGVLARFDIVSAVGEDSHGGRTTDTGVGVFDPITGAISMTGTSTTAKGDQMLWVALNTTDIGTHFAGGTGLFGDATGGFSAVQTNHKIEPTSDPMVVLSSYSYTGNGTIRYSTPATIRK